MVTRCLSRESNSSAFFCNYFIRSCLSCNTCYELLLNPSDYRCTIDIRLKASFLDFSYFSYMFLSLKDLYLLYSQESKLDSDGSGVSSFLTDSSSNYSANCCIGSISDCRCICLLPINLILYGFGNSIFYLNYMTK